MVRISAVSVQRRARSKLIVRAEVRLSVLNFAAAPMSIYKNRTPVAGLTRPTCQPACLSLAY